MNDNDNKQESTRYIIIKLLPVTESKLQLIDMKYNPSKQNILLQNTAKPLIIIRYFHARNAVYFFKLKYCFICMYTYNEKSVYYTHKNLAQFSILTCYREKMEWGVFERMYTYVIDEVVVWWCN